MNYFLVIFFLRHIQTESDAYEPTVHMHRWAQLQKQLWRLVARMCRVTMLQRAFHPKEILVSSYCKGDRDFSAGKIWGYARVLFQNHGV